MDDQTNRDTPTTAMPDAPQPGASDPAPESPPPEPQRLVGSDRVQPAPTRFDDLRQRMIALRDKPKSTQSVDPRDFQELLDILATHA